MIGRYQTDAIAEIFGDEARFARWTEVEVAACEAWHARGEINDADMKAIRTKAHHQSAARVREIEQETNHDVVAFVRAVAESVGEPAARHLHRGLTSSDVIDTALGLTLTTAIDVILESVHAFRKAVGRRALEYKDTPCPGRTHGIHAEPTTFGLRLAGWYTELSRTLERLEQAKKDVSFGKLSGAVGTFSQTDPEFEAFVLSRLGLQIEPVATQVVPRDRHAQVLTTLAILGGSLERFATEIRSLQRTDIREAEEPFTPGQTGSSAMPHKRNPITTERVTGMSRLLRGYAMAALENIALWHDRDISHSSVERVILPDAFHLADYMLQKLTAVVSDLRVYPEAMLENLDKTRGLLFSQSVLAKLLSCGLDRTSAYKLVQRNAMRVWEKEAKSFREALDSDADVQSALDGQNLDSAFDMSRYTAHVDTLFERAEIMENS